MLVNSKKIITWLEKQFPKDLAQEWDNVGFLIGNGDKTIKRIMITLEITPDVVQEAIDKNTDLIISHHPLIFKGVKNLVDQDPHQKMIRQLIFNDIHVYAAHTNADIAEGGVSDMFLDYLGLKAVDGLMSKAQTDLMHWIVYCPVEHKETLLKAVHQVGAGAMGNYSCCAFAVDGKGQYMPLEGSSPYRGTKNQLGYVNESRLEFIAPASLYREVEKAIQSVHPYETPAYSALPMINHRKIHSLGRIAVLNDTMDLKTLAEKIKKDLKISHLRLVGQPKTKVKRIAVLTGAGDDAMKAAKAKRCDVLITGDIKYHSAQDALLMGLPLIDVGHYNSEIIFKLVLKDRMIRDFEDMDYDVTVEASTSENDPFTWL